MNIDLRRKRGQLRFDLLQGWLPTTEWNEETGQEEPTGIWTAFEMSDHLEACELVREIGRLADAACASPEIDVRQNVVLVTATTPRMGLTEDDFDFALSIDREIGTFRRSKTLLSR